MGKRGTKNRVAPQELRCVHQVDGPDREHYPTGTERQCPFRARDLRHGIQVCRHHSQLATARGELRLADGSVRRVS